ncbi:MAG: class B sortase [Clostridia bacterium]|nr:class B sortase [Clostridia bacterium]
MSRKKSKHGKQTRHYIQIIFIIIFIISISAIAYYFYNMNKNILEDTKIDEEQVTEQRTERMLQLEELKKENQDIVGWIEIEGTNINYPVLQGTDNQYYMKHTYKKEDSKDGSIFLDKSYDWNIPSSNLLLYGHNNKNGTMFQDLLKYKEESFYKEHPTIRFTTIDEDCQYEIISAFLSRVYYQDEQNVFRYYYFINANNEVEYNQYIEESKKASLYDTGKSATYGEQLLTLSTCSYHTEDGRFAVVAKKIK